MPPRISDDKRAAILADVEAGEKSAGRIAKDHGVSVSTVSRLAAKAGAGDGWQRSKTKKATEAATADAEAKRTALSLAWLDLAAEAVAQARAELHDARPDKAATIAGIATDKHLALIANDRQDEHDLDGFDRLIEHITARRLSEAENSEG